MLKRQLPAPVVRDGIIQKMMLPILIVVAIVLPLGGRIVNSFRAVRIISYTRVTEGGTFSRHLEDIRQLTETWEPYIPAPTEHDAQLVRLREFATQLNTGGTEISDLRIIYIRSRPDWPRSIQVMFKHEEDYTNAQLIKEMLAFTGICEDDIYIQKLTWGFYIRGWPGSFEFMMPNQAAYAFLLPYLRLREFAMYLNSGTTYRDEIVITRIIDLHQSQPIGRELLPHHFPRYVVGLSPKTFTSEIKSEILEFAGLRRGEVQFEETIATFLSTDFLKVNEEWMQLHQQFERLRAFSDMVTVRSARQNIVMDRVISSFSFRSEGPDFIVWLTEHRFYNEDLREILLAFTGIPECSIHFELYDPYFAFSHTPTRRWLTPCQQVKYDTLEAFKEKVNAPFWYNRYLNDPVIVSIAPSIRRYPLSRRFVFRGFVITLYDPNLRGQTDIETAWRTRALRSEVIAATGIGNIRFRALPSR